MILSAQRCTLNLCGDSGFDGWVSQIGMLRANFNQFQHERGAIIDLI